MACSGTPGSVKTMSLAAPLPSRMMSPSSGNAAPQCRPLRIRSSSVGVERFGGGLRCLPAARLERACAEKNRALSAARGCNGIGADGRRRRSLASSATVVFNLTLLVLLHSFPGKTGRLRHQEPDVDGDGGAPRRPRGNRCAMRSSASPRLPARPLAFSSLSSCGAERGWSSSAPMASVTC